MTMLPLHVLLELVEVAVTFSHSYFFPQMITFTGRLSANFDGECLVNEVKIKMCAFFSFFR